MLLCSRGHGLWLSWEPGLLLCNEGMEMLGYQLASSGALMSSDNSKQASAATNTWWKQDNEGTESVWITLPRKQVTPTKMLTKRNQEWVVEKKKYQSWPFDPLQQQRLKLVLLAHYFVWHRYWGEPSPWRLSETKDLMWDTCEYELCKGTVLCGQQ